MRLVTPFVAICSRIKELTGISRDEMVPFPFSSIIFLSFLKFIRPRSICDGAKMGLVLRRIFHQREHELQIREEPFLQWVDLVTLIVENVQPMPFEIKNSGDTRILHHQPLGGSDFSGEELQTDVVDLHLPFGDSRTQLWFFDGI